MITAFTVKNFKAIGEEPVRIELKPITLLFGANSAGKSSILHALNYAYSVFNSFYNLNAQYNEHSDSHFDLGGFVRFVHHNDLKRKVVLRFELAFKLGELIRHNNNLLQEDVITESGPERLYNLIPMLDPEELLIDVEEAYVEVEIAYSNIEKVPYVSRYEVGFDSKPIATIYAEDSRKNVVCNLNKEHSVFVNLQKKHGISIDWLVKTCVKSEENVEYDNLNIKLTYQQDALPHLNSGLSLSIEYLNQMDSKKIKFGNPYLRDSRYSYLFVEQEPLKKYIFSQHTATTEQLFFALRNFLNCILVVPGLNVAGWLEHICYLGPLREIPPRHFTGGDNLDVNYRLFNMRPGLNRWRWEKGLAAWDIIYGMGQQKLDNTANTKLIDTINDWLDQRLNTGYEIRIEHYREIVSEFFTNFSEGEAQEKTSELIEKIISQPEKFRIWLRDKSRNLDLSPREVGTGISQVLPVVVAAVSKKQGLLVIEQPELHIHPAMQVQLGDLFIEQSNDQKFFLIETHSEHLLLRLLRRIRESAEGQTLDEVKLSPNNVAIYYVESESGNTQVNRIGLDENGRFTDRWPRGFFAERMHEMLPSDIRERVESKRREKL